MVEANVLVPGFAHVLPDWRATSHITKSVFVVLHDEGHPVYFVVETTQVHIFCSNFISKVVVSLCRNESLTQILQS